ncbi:MAG: GTP-binding protein [Pseudomonadota bacterium]
MTTAPLPVTIITGFLGAGKTTLLNTVLRDPEFADTAVLINEFGEVQIDHDLVADFTDELVMTTTGCMCCTASSDIKQSLFELWEKRQEGKTTPFKRVIVETTGLMDPVPVINSLLIPPEDNNIDQTVRKEFVLSRVITLFDIIFGPMALDQGEEALKQIALADTILLTKTDLAKDPATLRDLEEDKIRLSNINQGARLLDRQQDWSLIREQLLNPTAYDLHGRDEDVISWLDAENIPHQHNHSNGHSHHDHHHHAHGDHHHDVNRHGEDICSHVIFHDKPVTSEKLDGFLEFVKSSAGTDLLRIKGIFQLSDDEEKPVVVHGIQHVIYPIDRLDQWPSEDNRTKIVMIGRNLDIAGFEGFLKTP